MAHTVLRRKTAKAEKEVSKLEAKITRLKAEAESDGLKLESLGQPVATSDDLRKLAGRLSKDVATLEKRIEIVKGQVQKAVQFRDVANSVLDEAVSLAYKTQALAQHPDKRKSGSSADTLAFQRLRTAYETLRDPLLRRRYIETLDHDAFLVERAAQIAAENAAAQAAEEGARGRQAKGAKGGGGKPLALQGGLPNRCTCPTVDVMSANDATVLLQWSCRGATEVRLTHAPSLPVLSPPFPRQRDVMGYELQGCLTPRSGAQPVWEALTQPHEHPGTRCALSGLRFGEWMFRVRARSAQGGFGEFSMASEPVLLGSESVVDPEAAKRRKEEAAKRQAQRRAEVQEEARSHPQVLAKRCSRQLCRRRAFKHNRILQAAKRFS
jgi:hypothetical protein